MLFEKFNFFFFNSVQDTDGCHAVVIVFSKNVAQSPSVFAPLLNPLSFSPPPSLLKRQSHDKTANGFKIVVVYRWEICILIWQILLPHGYRLVLGSEKIRKHFLQSNLSVFWQINWTQIKGCLRSIIVQYRSKLTTRQAVLQLYNFRGNLAYRISPPAGQSYKPPQRNQHFV